ncbi:MAG: diol dehydratase small subunit [Caldilineaceae bacterium]
MNQPTPYPILENMPDLRSASGRAVQDITLEAAANGELSAADLQIRRETLHAQSQIAAEAGYGQLAANLARAAELTAVPNALLLQMYEMLRPRRCTFEELIALADRLIAEFDAPANAQLVHEAAEAYRTRNLLRRDE